MAQQKPNKSTEEMMAELDRQNRAAALGLARFEGDPFAEALGKLRAVSLAMAPFPHFVLDDFFTDEVYQSLLATAPTHGEYLRLSVVREQCMPPHVVPLDADFVNNISPLRALAWSSLKNFLNSQEFLVTLALTYEKVMMQCGLLRPGQTFSAVTEMWMTRQAYGDVSGEVVERYPAMFGLKLYLAKSDASGVIRDQLLERRGQTVHVANEVVSRPNRVFSWLITPEIIRRVMTPEVPGTYCDEVSLSAMWKK
jgi:hypothetical protein